MLKHVSESPTFDAAQASGALRAGEAARLARQEGVCGGVLCVRGTRVPVWVLEQCRRLNRPEAEILEDFPFLESADIHAAWDYAHHHEAEIADQIQANQGAGDA